MTTDLLRKHAGRAELFTFLDELGIATSTVEHPPLFTVEQSQQLRGAIPGGHVKNLFLKDKKDALFLIVAEEQAGIDLKTLHKAIGAARLSFGRPELLQEVLGVTPGSVTPFAAINDRDGRVKLIIDEDLMAHEVVNVHPLVNVATTSIRSTDLVAFLRATGHEPEILRLASAADEQ